MKDAAKSFSKKVCEEGLEISAKGAKFAARKTGSLLQAAGAFMKALGE